MIETAGVTTQEPKRGGGADAGFQIRPGPPASPKIPPAAAWRCHEQSGRPHRRAPFFVSATLGGMRTARNCLLLLLTGLCLSLAAPAQTAFFLHPNDRVVFYGDSITEQRFYTAYVESFVYTRFPSWHVQFLNTGWSGDQLGAGADGGGLARLQRDVLDHHPTVVTLLFGMNDGLYQQPQATVTQRFHDNLVKLVDRLKAAGIRVVILTPTAYDPYVRNDKPAPGQNHFSYEYPYIGYDRTLAGFAAVDREVAQAEGVELVPLHSAMDRFLDQGRTQDVSFHVAPEGVHPRPAGHLFMAETLLKAWNAPATAAWLNLDVQHPAASGLDLTGSNGDYHFTWTSPLPQPQDPQWEPEVLRVVNQDYSYNHYGMSVSGLQPGNYELLANGKPVGTYTAGQLQTGIELGANQNWPATKQAADLLKLVFQKNDVWYYQWRQLRLPISDRYAAKAGVDRALTDLEDEMTAHIHELAQPMTIPVELRRASGGSVQ